MIDRYRSQLTRPIAAIRIGKRHRCDLGDLEGLKASIRAVGLLHPVAITPDGKLIAGERRLRACKKLGWSDVPVRVLDIDAIARGELAENTLRKDFTPSELVAIAATVEKRERELAKQRMTLGKVSTGSEPGKTRDKVAAPLGVSGRTLEKARAVVRAAEAAPKQFGHLVAEMDRTGKVNAAHRELRRARDQERHLNTVPKAGKFKTLVLDPPWAYDPPHDLNFLGRGRPDYGTMTREQVLALPVPAWAEDECHLYLWTTNAVIPLAVECMAAWGFQHKSMLTWAKPTYGLGTQFRGQTEHVLFGIKGKLSTRCTNISTLFEAPRGKHSEKPERFYQIVRAASYPAYGEAFQVKARPDFVNLYEEKTTCGGRVIDTEDTELIA